MSRLGGLFKKNYICIFSLKLFNKQKNIFIFLWTTVCIFDRQGFLSCIIWASETNEKYYALTMQYIQSPGTLVHYLGSSFL